MSILKFFLYRDNTKSSGLRGPLLTCIDCICKYKQVSPQFPFPHVHLFFLLVIVHNEPSCFVLMTFTTCLSFQASTVTFPLFLATTSCLAIVLGFLISGGLPRFLSVFLQCGFSVPVALHSAPQNYKNYPYTVNAIAQCILKSANLYSLFYSFFSLCGRCPCYNSIAM